MWVRNVKLYGVPFSTQPQYQFLVGDRRDATLFLILLHCVRKYVKTGYANIVGEQGWGKMPRGRSRTVMVRGLK